MDSAVMEAPVAPAGDGGFDLDSRLESSFSAVPDTEVTDTTDQGTGEAPPLPEGTAQADGGEDNQPIVDDESESEEFTDDAGRKYYNVKPTRMREFVNAKNFMKEMADFAPTIEDAKAHYESASDFRALQSDFASGEPEGVQNFMGFWSNGAPEAFNSMATQLPAYLARLASQNNPGALQALRSIEGQVHRATISEAYDKARQTGDPKDLYAAQSIDFSINGKYHDSLDKIPQRQQPQPQDQVRQREQQISQREEQFANQRWQEFDGTAITGAKDAALTSAVDAAFKVAESAFTPGLLSAAKREATAQVTEVLKKQFEWNRNQTVDQKDIQRDFLKAVRTGARTNLEPRAAALVQSYKARIAAVLPGIVRPLIGERTQAVMQQSAQTHQRLAKGATRTAPGAGGSPAPRSIAPRGQRQSVDNRLDQIFS